MLPVTTYPKVFFSHTTKDSRDHFLAHKLATGLRDRGAQVWIAPDNIPVGSVWEEQIVDAIIRQCTHFFVILSAQSVAAEWVLKEIALAEKRRRQDASFTILPLAVGNIGAYPGSDFINRFQFVSYREEFSAQLDALISSLPLHPHLPFHYEELINDFVGRTHVYTALETFMSTHDSGCFTIVGDPGEGKTAILAEYVRRTGCVAHFNIRAEGIIHAKQCLNSIASQLSARYGLSLQPLPMNPMELSSYWQDLFRLARAHLGQSQEAINKESRLVILIDGLDEVERSNQSKGTNVLFLPHQLPKGVFLLLSRRRERLPFVNHAPQQTFDLGDYSNDNRQDIETYLWRAIDRYDLRSWLQTHLLDRGEFIRQVADKSNNNFMYLRYVLPEIVMGSYNGMRLDMLPVGLQGYYEDHWERMGMRANPLPYDKLRIIYVMSTIRIPASRQLIAEFTKRDPVVVQAVIDEWSPFLHRQLVDDQWCYSIYHSSFLDFLHRKEIVQAAGETMEGIHASIAKELLRGLLENE